MVRTDNRLKDALVSLKRTLLSSKVALENRLKYRNRDLDDPGGDVSGQNVLFLVVDCLREDHLSPEYERETTPFLGQFDRARAVSAAPWTFPSVPSILSGRYPRNHGAIYSEALRNQEQGDPPRAVRDDVYTLPELLDPAGYRTYLSTAIATAEIPIRGRFQSVSVHHEAPADVLVDDLLSWWDTYEEDPKFGYVHLGDLHAPLQIPDEQPFGPIPEMDGLTRWRFTDTTEPEAEFNLYRSERIRLYDTVLHFVDRELKRLYEELAARDELDDTLVVITGDHGEEFWEREHVEREHFHDPRGVYGAGHGHALVPEVVDVPLILPDVTVETANSVSTTDILPTVLSELGYPVDGTDSFDGRPLQDAQPERVVRSEEVAYGYDQQAVVKGDYYLISSPREDELLLLDRSQQDPVHDEEKLAQLSEHLESDRTYGTEVVIDEQTEKRLADLGYID